MQPAILTWLCQGEAKFKAIASLAVARGLKRIILLLESILWFQETVPTQQPANHISRCEDLSSSREWIGGRFAAKNLARTNLNVFIGFLNVTNPLNDFTSLKLFITSPLRVFQRLHPPWSLSFSLAMSQFQLKPPVQGSLDSDEWGVLFDRHSISALLCSS